MKIVWVAGGEPREVFRTKKTGLSLSWTADGRRVVVGESDQDDAVLWLVPVDGGKPPQKFTLGKGVLELRWSPMGPGGLLQQVRGRRRSLGHGELPAGGQRATRGRGAEDQAVSMTPLRARMRPGKPDGRLSAVAGVSVFALVWLGVGICPAGPRFRSPAPCRTSGGGRRLGGCRAGAGALGRRASARRPAGRLRASPGRRASGGGSIRSGLQVWPDRALLYYPTATPLARGACRGVSRSRGARVREPRPDGAIAALRRLSASRDAAVKAGADSGWPATSARPGMPRRRWRSTAISPR